jgi:hypothetical protein
MAKYENLPIYRKAIELLVYVEQTVRSFPGEIFPTLLPASMRAVAAGFIPASPRPNKGWINHPATF